MFQLNFQPTLSGVSSNNSSSSGSGRSSGNYNDQPLRSSTSSSTSDVFVNGSISSHNVLHDLSRHPKVRALETARWDNSVYTLSVARSAYAAAVVECTSDLDQLMKEVIIIAGGRGARKNGTPSKVLNSIEVFDPSRNNQAQLCQHRLNTARYSCGAFAVTTNVICILGGKDQNNEYLSSVEIVSEQSAQLLDGVYTLPEPMACFGVATIADKVYIFGGKSKSSTLARVYSADLSCFINANNGNASVQYGENGTVWTKVGTLGTPRHSFSVVMDEDICWLVGGFDGRKLLNSVGMYHTRYNQFIHHPLTLAVARSGLSSFNLGRNIVVLGGIASTNNNSSYNGATSYTGSRGDFGNQLSAVTAELLLRKEEGSDINKIEAFVAISHIDCPQKEQKIFQIGYKVYAIGQYNFLSAEPTCTIPSMNLINLREAFEIDQKVDGIVVAKDFPMPVIPMDPAEPKMSPDVVKLKHSIGEWKKQIEGKTSEYIANVQDASSTSQVLHDKVVELWIQEINKTKGTMVSSNPDMQNSDDKKVTKRQVDDLRLEFERQKQKLEQESDLRIRRRNDEYVVLSTQCNTQIQNLEKSVAEYGTRLQQHQERLQTHLLTWINNKKNDVTNMEGIVSNTAPGPKTRDEIERTVDFTEDRRKLHLVYSGLEAEPVMVSKQYGRHCTNNYDVKNQIGVGGFGSVYQGNDITLRSSFAFKRVSMTVDNPQKLEGVLKTFQREISTLKRVRHPNIVALYGYHMEPGSDDSFLVYELLDRGSLAVFLKNEEGRVRLPYLRRLRIMSESLRALNFLHTGGCAGVEIQHRDIKPHNICLTEDWSSKLIDCGLARIERIEDPSDNGSTTFFSSAYGLVGTDGYICRAYWNGMRPYLSACDIYSFGIVMVELITGSLNRQNKEFPGDFYNHFIATISGNSVQNSLSKLMERCDELVVWDENDLPKLCKLALQCLALDVSKRPTAKTLVYEISKMLLQGEIGELPEAFVRNDTHTTNSQTPPCSICNEQRDHFIQCKNKHNLCSQCITQEAVKASNVGSENVKCPIMECRCTFDVRKDLYSIVPQDVYNKTTAEGRIIEYLERIEQKQNRVVSEISLVRRGVNRGLQAVASLTTSGNSPCPKLVWIIPGKSISLSARNPTTWVKGLTEVPVKVYFLCEHSFTPISAPVVLTVKRKWLGHIAPALKVTLFCLKLTTALAGLPFPIANIDSISEQVQMATVFVDGLLKSEQLSLINRSETLFTEGLQEFDREQMKSLTGKAYDLLADGVRTGGQLTWQDELKPVLNENGATIWVKNEYIARYSLSDTRRSVDA